MTKGALSGEKRDSTHGTRRCVYPIRAKISSHSDEIGGTSRGGVLHVPDNKKRVIPDPKLAVVRESGRWRISKNGRQIEEVMNQNAELAFFLVYFKGAESSKDCHVAPRRTQKTPMATRSAVSWSVPRVSARMLICPENPFSHMSSGPGVFPLHFTICPRQASDYLGAVLKGIGLPPWDYSWLFLIRRRVQKHLDSPDSSSLSLSLFLK